jgi:hypothetical protein
MQAAPQRYAALARMLENQLALIAFLCVVHPFLKDFNASATLVLCHGQAPAPLIYACN